MMGQGIFSGANALGTLAVSTNPVKAQPCELGCQLKKVPAWMWVLGATVAIGSWWVMGKGQEKTTPNRKRKIRRNPRTITVFTRPEVSNLIKGLGEQAEVHFQAAKNSKGDKVAFNKEYNKGKKLLDEMFRLERQLGCLEDSGLL